MKVNDPTSDPKISEDEKHLATANIIAIWQ